MSVEVITIAREESLSALFEDLGIKSLGIIANASIVGPKHHEIKSEDLDNFAARVEEFRPRQMPEDPKQAKVSEFETLSFKRGDINYRILSVHYQRDKFNLFIAYEGNGHSGGTFMSVKEIRKRINL